MIPKRPKLIFLWNYIEWGGAQIYFLAIMKEALRDCDIVVILPRNSLPDILNYLESLGVRYEFIDACLDSGAVPTVKRKLQRQLRRIHAEFTSFRHLFKYNLRESILHIETAPWQSWLFLTALAMRRANVFVTMHNFLPDSSKWRETVWKTRLQFVSRLPGFHIFPSNQDTKDKLKGWVEAEFWKKMKVTYTAVNPTEIDAAFRAGIDVSEIRRRHGINENKFLVLCVGQFIDRKGRWVFLDAAKLVLNCDKEVAFAWLTPKMPGDAELARIEAYRLGDCFRLILSASAGKDRSDVLKFFRIADVFVLPSFVEGLPIALLEAMALGLPSISTNVYGIPEAIKHLETGILIEVGDSQALANSILTMKNDYELRQKLSHFGRDFVLKTFDEQSVAKIVIESYRDSLRGK